MKFSTHPLSPDLATRRDLQAAPLDLELADRLRTSLRGMLGHGEALADVFYANLFTHYPELCGLFKGDVNVLKHKFLTTLEWIIGNLDRPSDVRVAARELGKKHERFGVKPEHYAIFGDMLVDAMGKVAGNQWNRDIQDEWRVSIDLLSALMTGRSAIRRDEKTGTRA